jgi:hypothetical protein
MIAYTITSETSRYPEQGDLQKNSVPSEHPSKNIKNQNQ